MDSKMASEKRMLQLSELEEFRDEAYENVKIYKEKMKTWHDKHISRKLKSRWSGPFTMTQVFQHGGAEIRHP